MLRVPAAHPSQYSALAESPLIAHVGENISGEVLPEIVAWLYTYRVGQDSSCCGTGTRAVVSPAELQSRPAGSTALCQFPQRLAVSRSVGPVLDCSTKIRPEKVAFTCSSF